MRQHRFRPGSFPCRVDRHGKRAAGKIQQLRYVSDVDAQAAKWGLENHAPDVGRSAEPAAVKYWIASVPSSRSPPTGFGSPQSDFWPPSSPEFNFRFALLRRLSDSPIHFFSTVH